MSCLELMARKKQYNEADVIDKAMHVFWQNGYKGTSMQMLEDEMGINKFSIYSSFGSKKGLFLESINSYKKKTNQLFEKLIHGTKGLDDIKEFFYDSVNICHEKGNIKGCLVTNTYYEFSDSEDVTIQDNMEGFMSNLKTIFIEKLRMDSTKDDATIMKQANFLLLAKHGLAASTKVNTKKEIEDYIEMTFSKL